MRTFKFSIALFAFILILITLNGFSQSNDRLLGVWGFKKGDNAVFEIKSDSIYYLDVMSSVKYSATNDSLIFYFDGFRYNTKHRVS